MSLKVIGAGFGRTGTLSTYTALNQLGLRCYHMFEVIGNKDNKTHLGFWSNVADNPEAGTYNYDEVFNGYEAMVDNPGCCVYKELMVKYPDAKVLLTLHPKGAEAWYESTMDTIYFTETMWQFKVLKMFTPFGKKMGNLSTKLIWQYSHKGTMTDKAKAIAHYNWHIKDVIATVPAERLLVYQVNEGWGPLCEFVGKEVPNTPFPNVNDRAEIKATIANITKGAYVILALIGLLTAGGIFGLLKALGVL